MLLILRLNSQIQEEKDLRNLPALLEIKHQYSNSIYFYSRVILSEKEFDYKLSSDQEQQWDKMNLPHTIKTNHIELR